jgi:type II secretion system protein I
VLVALAIVAFGMGALMSVLTSSANSTSYLREKSFAEWVGFNQLSTTRLSLNPVAVGSTEGDVTMADTQWHWQQQIEAMEIATLFRITIQVRRSADPNVPSGHDPPWIATVLGFKGTALGAANGSIPRWASNASSSGTTNGTVAADPVN